MPKGRSIAYGKYQHDDCWGVSALLPQRLISVAGRYVFISAWRVVASFTDEYRLRPAPGFSCYLLEAMAKSGFFNSHGRLMHTIGSSRKAGVLRH